MPELKSYSHLGEDLVLWGALCDIDGGFYIDAGAAHPILGSVSHLFYEQGWSGINIEPRPKEAAEFAAERPRDMNLQMAVSNRQGTITLHEIPDCLALSTVVTNLADGYKSNGLACNSYDVSCKTLAAVCAEYVRGEIHFLKIDVEGAEREVLEGCDFNQYRPWILAIESTVPTTDIPSHEEWEPLVLAAGYEFALFHKINRYYVAREHASRKDRIQPRPDLVRIER